MPQSTPAGLAENALVTLGVHAGPPPVPNKTGISTALKLVPTSTRSIAAWAPVNTFTNAGFTFDDLKSMVIPHLHTDHMVDYWSFFRSGRLYGLERQSGRECIRSWLCRRFAAEPGRQVRSRRERPRRPDATPGLATATDALQQAFAYTNNIFSAT